MTKSVDTAFERHFSEPPVLAIKEGRTHCEACQEPLDPSVMHKCHGNQEYQAPVISSTEITEKCPNCSGEAKLFQLDDRHGIPSGNFIVVCTDCRLFVRPPTTREHAIAAWNAITISSRGETWPEWMADLPGDDERANVISSEAKPAHPDLSGYKGVCPAVHVDGEVCDWCEGTGTIPPTKPEGAQ